MTFQNTTMNEPRTAIQTFYKGKTIFITGASGFMGKVLLEKLLYSCSDLDKIYILIRPKRGHSVESRIDNMFKLPMFHRICQEKSHILKKVLPLDGDISKHNLGLTDEQRKTLMSEVHIVFHVAATLRLEAKLKDSIELNLIGTKRVLDLARQIKHLQVFVHLSTAFCHVERERIDEDVYDAPHDPEDIMRLVQWMDESAIDLLTPKLLGPFPNTYIYAKRLAETLVSREYPNLPCVIVRPSIVIPALKEPLPGWVDNLNGPTGIIVAAGKGVLRTMLCNIHNRAEVVPVDLAINYIIAITHKMGTQQNRPKNIPVYHTVNKGTVPITWGEVLEKGKIIAYQYPFEGQAWYPDGDAHTNKFVHYMLAFFFHVIPAYLIDFLMLIFLQKRFMVKIQKRISTGLDVLQYFTMRNWIFDNSKRAIMLDTMSPEDKQIFPILPTVNVNEYMKISLLGMRQYCMKESLSSLPKARRHQARMYIVHLLTKFLFYFGILFLIYKNFEIVRYCLHFIIELMKSLSIMSGVMKNVQV